MNGRNIYQTARNLAGLTQERASEAIGIPTRTLRGYESGARIPPNYIVKEMCIYYNQPTLAYQHMMAADELAADLLPEIETHDLSQTVIQLYMRFRKIDQQADVDRLMEIAEDGKITDEERPDFDKIVQDISEIIAAGLQLKLCGIGGKEDQHDPT